MTDITNVKFKPTTEIFTIHSSSEPLVTFNVDGTMIFGPNYEPDEAAKTFWQAMGLWGLRTSMSQYSTEDMEAEIARRKQIDQR